MDDVRGAIVRAFVVLRKECTASAPEVHLSLADWVNKGGVLVMVDDARDPYNRVRVVKPRESERHIPPGQHRTALIGSKFEVRCLCMSGRSAKMAKL